VTEQDDYSEEQLERLLTTLAEQIKLPWLELKHAGELRRLGLASEGQLLEMIDLTSQAALQLVDGYLLSMQVLRGQLKLELEPVSLASLLEEVRHRLADYAAAHGCKIELEVQGRYGPVMAHKRALESALLNLAYSFVEVSQAEDTAADIHLVVRKTAGGVSAGMYSAIESLSNDMLARARRLYGRARQPLSALGPNAGAGFFVADTLLGSMASHVQAARYHAMPGLSATFVQSRQLSLI
jgi:signal transduction histidine kinase